MFDENSGLVKIWVRRILNGATIEDVPNISNLKEIVQEVIDNASNND